LFTGWKGWEMVYRHRVGVSDEAAGETVSRTRAGRRSCEIFSLVIPAEPLI
jgi:hypothetical protein